MSTGSADIVITNIDDKLNVLPHTPSKASIPRIDSHYRNVGSDTIYDPEILSIGPYHHGNPRLHNMEQFKYMYLKRLLKRRNEPSVDRYVTAVVAMEKRARQCYVGSINLDENQFLTLLVLDGIFLIEFFRCFYFESLRDEDDPLVRDEILLNQLRHDILLLENQLPMFFLNQLFNMTKTNENVVSDDNDHLIKLAFRFFGTFHYRSFPESRFWDVQKIDHLCGLIHDGWCLPFAETLSPPSNGYWEFINSASGLREAGIKFQAAYEDSLMDIKFVKGVLIIPKLMIHDRSESELRNLIVHEQYLPGGSQRCFSDYSFFIYCLIKTSNDVDLLRSHGIILNLLGHDEEVCLMFNRLGKHVMLSSDFCYSQVFCSVNRHCRHRGERWRANLRKNYFNSPWSIISFLAAVALLILTFTQTIYTLLAYYYR